VLNLLEDEGVGPRKSRACGGCWFIRHDSSGCGAEGHDSERLEMNWLAWQIMAQIPVERILNALPADC